MFDPFKDFQKAGYLRNSFQEKDPELVRKTEHAMFRAGLDEALEYLSQCRKIEYDSFLHVHRILFSEFYPWAGQDRLETAPNYAVSKAGTMFCHPQDIKRAIDAGLRLGQDKTVMRTNSGEVMGLFAYGHPFLDGNGRTMLLIHSELCHRAGFRIAWHNTHKREYLKILSNEIATPGKGLLNAYLEDYIQDSSERQIWKNSLTDIQGLDGSSAQNSVDGDYSDAGVMAKYQEFEHKRNHL